MKRYRFSHRTVGGALLVVCATVASASTLRISAAAAPPQDESTPVDAKPYKVVDAQEFIASQDLSGVMLNTPAGVVSASEFVASEDATKASRGQEVAVYADGAVGLNVPSGEPVSPPPEYPMPTTYEEDLKELARLEAEGIEFRDQATSLLRGVFGSDGRQRQVTQVTPKLSELWIYRAYDGAGCTGSLYRPNKVMTAAHCLFNRSTNSFYPGPYYVELAVNGNIHPYASCQAVGGMFTLAAYSSNSGPEYDFGGFTINCNYPDLLGQTIAPIVALPSGGLQGYRDGLYITGYPQYAVGRYVWGESWGMVGRVIYDSYLKSLNVDTSGGQSGAGWYIPCADYGWGYCNIGPHKGDSQFLFGGMNMGHKVTSGDIALLIAL